MKIQREKEPKGLDLLELENKLGDVFARLHYKINCDVKNNTQDILALDLLQSNVKKDLLSIAVATLEEFFLELLYAQAPMDDQNVKASILSLIKKVATKFLTKHYGCEIELSSRFLSRSQYIKSLLADKELLYTTPISTLIDSEMSTFRLFFAPIYNYASETFIESLMDNLILEISNSVVYLIIVDFATIYALRQTVYQSRFLSLRNLERFKNNLSWQIKIKTLVQRPLDLYTNRYGLYIIRGNGVYYRRVYANRSKEINSLTGLPLLTVLFIESKDFLVSRVDEIFYSLGNSLRFLLTSTLGQIIALVWRGIIEGLKKGK